MINELLRYSTVTTVRVG